MKLQMIGLSHLTSRLATRERAALGRERLPEAVAQLRREAQLEGVVVLSTCNRLELYLSPKVPLPDAALRRMLAEVCRLTPEEVLEATIAREDAAATHLFRVAAGLESQMLGEMQIQGQVKEAYQTALELKSSNGFLNGLFLRAIECGKMVRNKTGISRGAVSVASASIDYARRIFGRLSARRVLLIGAGETIRLAASYLEDDGVTGCRISNRTPERALDVAARLSGVVVAFPPSLEDLVWAELVVSATRAPSLLVPVSLVAQTFSDTPRPRLFLDLSVPRAIDPSLGTLPLTYVRSVDDFQELVKANLLARESEAERASELVQQAVGEFVTWYQENRIAPTISQLQKVLEQIRSNEVESNVRRFKDEDRDQVDKFSKALVKRISGLIIANMKRASLTQNDLSLADAVTRAFSLDAPEAMDETQENQTHELPH